MLGTPGMVALDLDASLKGLFQKIVKHLESIPKPQGENISAITCDLSVRVCNMHIQFLCVGPYVKSMLKLDTFKIRACYLKFVSYSNENAKP